MTFPLFSLRKLKIGSLLASLLLGGCGNSSAEDSCTPGRSVACDCLGSQQGVQLCLADKTFGPCQCAGDQSDGGASAGDSALADGGSTADPDLTHIEEEGGPTFISLGTNVLSLTWGERLVFSAVLTDPDGIEDLIGGSLTSPDGTLSYGSFATSSQEGAYSLSLDWHQINQSIPIEFVTEEQRVFVAEFWDAAGHRSAKSVVIRLHCEGIGACEGYCVDLQTSTDHCTACRKQCSGICAVGKCWDTPVTCLDDSTTYYATHYPSCNEYCADGRGTCVGGIRYDPEESGQYRCSAAIDAIECDDTLNYAVDEYRCCCTDKCSIVF